MASSHLTKHTRSRGGGEPLSINSMMDIMVIILVFLLKSYSTEDITVAASADLTLPTSSASKAPERSAARHSAPGRPRSMALAVRGTGALRWRTRAATRSALPR